MKCEILFLKKNKNITSLSSAESANRVVSVKHVTEILMNSGWVLIRIYKSSRHSYNTNI